MLKHKFSKHEQALEADRAKEPDRLAETEAAKGTEGGWLGFARRRLAVVGELSGIPAFGLAVVATILAALAATSMVSLYLLQQYLAQRQMQAAPVTMNLVSHMVRENIRTPDRLHRVVGDIGRMPNIRSCRVTVLDASGAEKQRITSHTPAEVDSALYLKSEIIEDLRDGAPGDRQALGMLEIWYDRNAASSARAVMTALWTAAGAVGAVSLAVFALLFRHLLNRMRPIAFVRDNLMAYHSGAEKSLEVLAVNDAASSVAQAWNSLIRFVEQMQGELREVRCRQAVAASMQSAAYTAGRAILDAMPLGVLHLDSEGMLTYCNYSAARMLNLDLAERMRNGESPAFPLALGEQVHEPSLMEALRSVCTRSGADGGVRGGREFVDHALTQACEAAAGRTRTVVRLTPIQISGKARDLIGDDSVVMVQDVSQLIEAEKSRDAFLAHITHELRTPLTNIRAYAETLTQDIFDDEKTRRECYNVITSETRRLSRLIEDVLSVSQIESGVSRFERVTLRLDQSLRQAVQDVQASADARSIELGLRIPSKVPSISGDRQRLHQVWVNLLGNAVKYTPEGGSVTVTVQSDENTVRVLFADSGIGIAQEHHEKIFEKFYRVPDAHEFEGTGLGLPIARDIVRMHGGQVHVESEPGAGSTFIVELPRARDAATENTGEVVHGSNRHR